MLYKRTSRVLSIKSLIVFAIIFVVFGNINIFAQNSQKIVKIGVLAKSGVEKCIEQWTPTAEYLSEKIPEYNFKIVPLEFDILLSSVNNNEIDFILSNPSIYVELEVMYGATRIATLRNIDTNGDYTVFGGVIFFLTERDDIQDIRDLKGKTFAAVHETSFGGWLAAKRELKNEGINPKDFKNMIFAGTHEEVVKLVYNGQVDVGTVRTDTLENMAKDGKIDISTISVLRFKDSEQQDNTNKMFLHSTRLYPEWPMAKMKKTPRDLAQKVAIALLSMPPNSPAAVSSNSAGWTVPLNYQSIQ